jgi:hypothetical protein
LSEKEHPARTAGRFVRAAGLAIQKGLEERQAASDERAEAERQAAAARPPAEAPQASPAAPPPPAFPPKPFLDRVLYAGFILSIVAVCLAALQIQMVTTGSVRVGIRLGLGIVLVLMSLPLLTNWEHTKERLVANFLKRFWGIEEPTTRSGRAVRRLGKELLTLVGIAWLALGMFELLRAFVDP